MEEKKGAEMDEWRDGDGNLKMILYKESITWREKRENV